MAVKDLAMHFFFLCLNGYDLSIDMPLPELDICMHRVIWI
jgi:hypothetical protein